MNLNQMSSVYKTQTNNAVGFKFKSKTSGRVFTAQAKTPGGRFLIVSECGTKDDLVLGTPDRYEFTDPAMAASGGRRAEINERMAQLMNKEGEIDQKIETLTGDVEEIRDQIAELEVELDSMDECGGNCEI